MGDIKKEIKNTEKQVTMKTQPPKIYGCSRSLYKRKVYSNISLHQEKRKTSNKQINLTSKATRKKNNNQKNPKVNRRKEIIKIRAEINEEEKEIIVKMKKTTGCFFEKTKLTNH